MLRNKSVLDAAVALFVNDFIDEHDFFAVYENTSRKSPAYLYWSYERLETQLQQMNDDECKAEFRLGLSELPVLAEALRIPEKFTCPNRTVATGMEGLCITLKRFAYPCRFSDMLPDLDDLFQS